MAEVSSSIQDKTISNRRGLRGYWSSARTSLFWMFAIAFALRLAYILIAHTYKVKPDQNYFGFGYEMGRIGHAIATGRGFADPFGPATGPTAWEPPLYPYLIAAVFKLSGIYTRIGIHSPLHQQRFFGADLHSYFLDRAKMLQRKSRCLERVGLGVVADGHVLVHALGLGDEPGGIVARAYFLAGAGIGKSNGAIPWVGFGLLWGVAALTNTSLVTFLPASGLWVMVPNMESREAIAGRRRVGRGFLRCNDRAVAGAQL